MTYTENLIVVAMEECSELQKSLAKLLRFGKDDHRPGKEQTNEESVFEEYLHIQAMMEELEAYGIISRENTAFSTDETYNKEKLDKKKRVEKFAYYAYKNGLLNIDKQCGICDWLQCGICQNKDSINHGEQLPVDYPACAKLKQIKQTWQ